jgi:ssDNA-binding Zn-finger/Zn-ribbon topoisomerase 1
MGDIWILLVVGGVLCWLVAKGSAATSKGDYSPQSPLPPPMKQPSSHRDPLEPPTSFGERAEPTSKYSSSNDATGKPVTSGFQPSDRCSCGGSWVKRENSETGGRFFSCSRYPKCRNTRDQVLRDKLGPRYADLYCSRGHEKAHFGTVADPRTGREICNRCIAKGYVRPPRASYQDDDDVDDLDDRPMWFGDPDDDDDDDRRRNSKPKPKPKPKVGSRTSSCRNGHPRTPENTYTRPDGSIECRICRKNAR